MVVNPCDEKAVADKILEEWDDVCNRLGIKHFLLWGTCLGFYRDKGYIKNDDDIDVGVLGSENDFKRLIEELLKKGFWGQGFGPKQEYKKNSKYPMHHLWKHNMLLDIYFSFYSGDRFLKSFDTVTYHGRVYNVPHPIEQFLKWKYDDWRTPKYKGA